MTQITIAANDAVDQYAVGSTPTTGPWTISYPYFNENDIKVYVDGVLKTITTHYTISGTAVDDGFSGGAVTFVANISNVTLTLNRDVPIARESDFPTSGIFNIGTLNTTLDKAYAILQQINTIISRAISRPSTSAETYSLVWPDGFDTTERTVKITTSGGIEVGPSVAEINNAASNAAATAADLVLTNADVVSTAADAVSTAADVTAVTGVTSTTSLAITVASKAFTVASGLSLQAGDWVICTSDANPSVNYMHGPISSYTGTTLTVNVDNIGGSGTLADWTIRRSGTQGATGNTGATGPTGPAVGNLNNIGDVTLTTPSNGQALTYNGSIWVNGSGGGGLFKGDNGETGSSAGDIFRCNEAELNANVTIAATENASATGPVGVASGVTLTVEGVLVIL